MEKLKATIDGIAYEELPDGTFETKVMAGKRKVDNSPHPEHYANCAIEPIEYIEANGLGFMEGSIVKYITRHNHKGGAADIRKIIKYANLILQYQYGE